MSSHSEVDGSYWFPLGTRPVFGAPNVGAVVAFQHQAWQVVEIRPLPREQWRDVDRLYVGGKRKPEVVRLRPMRLASHPDPVKAASGDVHYGTLHVSSWDVYPDPEHYPVCACCAEPMPCRAEVGRKMAQAAVETMGRYETPGACPACTEVVTARQKAITFLENLEVIGGPPVFFHLRSKCWEAAMVYEQRWAAGDRDRRRTTLSCAGSVTNHNDGTYDCTALDNCPGPVVYHRDYAVCACPECHTGPWRWGRGCRPHPSATLNLDNTPDKEGPDSWSNTR